MTSILKGIGKIFVVFGVNLLVILILVAVLEMVLGVGRAWYHNHYLARQYVEDHRASLKNAFPNLDDYKLMALYKETRESSVQSYAPWVQFVGTDYSGDFVNASEGRRWVPDFSDWNNGKPSPKTLDVFFFGGSTMFGSGVSDNQTIPSYFRHMLGNRGTANVYNFGNPWYFSKQESVKFANLLMEGMIPDVAIFMDGLNDVMQKGATLEGAPFYTDALANVFQPSGWFPLLLRHSNIVRAAKMIGMHVPGQSVITGYKLPDDYTPDAAAQELVEKYMQTQALTQSLCEHYNIKCLFVWQPVPFYHYNNPDDSLSYQGSSQIFTMVYDRMKKIMANRDNMLFLGNLLENETGQPFVDGFHYSPAFSKKIAQQIHMSLTREGGSGGL